VGIVEIEMIDADEMSETVAVRIMGISWSAWRYSSEFLPTMPSRYSRQSLMQPFIPEWPALVSDANASTRKTRIALTTGGETDAMTDDDRRRRHPSAEHLEDRLDLLRGAPRDRALEILAILLEAVYGDGYREGVEDVKPRPTSGTSMVAGSGSSNG
jgi:hypothetical protein